MKLLYVLCIGLILIYGCTGQVPAEPSTPMPNKTGDAMMENKVIKTGDTVTLDYIGTLDNGTVFDTSIESAAKEAGLPQRPSYEPFTFTVGSGQVIEGFDKGVIGMKAGEEKTIRIESDEAYGPRIDDYILSVPIANITGGENLTVGGIIYANGGAQQGVITNITDGNATVDFNHPLAGKDINFRLIVRKIA